MLGVASSNWIAVNRASTKASVQGTIPMTRPRNPSAATVPTPQLGLPATLDHSSISSKRSVDYIDLVTDSSDRSPSSRVKRLKRPTLWSRDSAKGRQDSTRTKRESVWDLEDDSCVSSCPPIVFAHSQRTSSGRDYKIKGSISETSGTDSKNADSSIGTASCSSIEPASQVTETLFVAGKITQPPTPLTSYSDAYNTFLEDCSLASPTSLICPKVASAELVPTMARNIERAWEEPASCTRTIDAITIEHNHDEKLASCKAPRQPEQGSSRYEQLMQISKAQSLNRIRRSESFPEPFSDVRSDTRGNDIDWKYDWNSQASGVKAQFLVVMDPASAESPYFEHDYDTVDGCSHVLHSAFEEGGNDMTQSCSGSKFTFAKDFSITNHDPGHSSSPAPSIPWSLPRPETPEDWQRYVRYPEDPELPSKAQIRDLLESSTERHTSFAEVQLGHPPQSPSSISRPQESRKQADSVPASLPFVAEEITASPRVELSQLGKTMGQCDTVSDHGTGNIFGQSSEHPFPNRSRPLARVRKAPYRKKKRRKVPTQEGNTTTSTIFGQGTRTSPEAATVTAGQSPVSRKSSMWTLSKDFQHRQVNIPGPPTGHPLCACPKLPVRLRDIKFFRAANHWPVCGPWVTTELLEHIGRMIDCPGHSNALKGECIRLWRRNDTLTDNMQQPLYLADNVFQEPDVATSGSAHPGRKPSSFDHVSGPQLASVIGRRQSTIPPPEFYNDSSNGGTAQCLTTTIASRVDKGKQKAVNPPTSDPWYAEDRSSCKTVRSKAGTDLVSRSTADHSESPHTVRQSPTPGPSMITATASRAVEGTESHNQENNGRPATGVIMPKALFPTRRSIIQNLPSNTRLSRHRSLPPPRALTKSSALGGEVGGVGGNILNIVRREELDTIFDKKIVSKIDQQVLRAKQVMMEEVAAQLKSFEGRLAPHTLPVVATTATAATARQRNGTDQAHEVYLGEHPPHTHLPYPELIDIWRGPGNHGTRFRKAPYAFTKNGKFKKAYRGLINLLTEDERAQY